MEPQELRALVAAPPWRRGRLALEPGADRGDPDEVASAGKLRARDEPGLTFEVIERRGRLAELVLHPSQPFELDSVAATLAAAGLPVVGDGQRGGIEAPGGMRIRAAGAEPELWWPDLQSSPASQSGELPVLRVSRAAARAVDRGHPWVLPDAESDSAERHAPGTLVALEVMSKDGGRRREVPSRERTLALIEGGAVAARVWARHVKRPRDAPSVEARVARALSRRRALLDPVDTQPLTDVYRLIHGEADDLPGVAVDRLGPVLRVLASGRALEPWLERLETALVAQLAGVLGGDPPVVEVLHLRSAPPGRLECVRLARGQLEPGRIRVRERGLSFWVDPGLDEPERPRPGFGLFPDQRDNRARLADCAARGGRWLNLFAHTGAFSVALLAAGAEEVVSVDLSSAYLERIEENLESNAAMLRVGSHQSVRRDARRFLEASSDGDGYHGIVLDPPTAAAAGRRYWSVARGLEGLIGAALERLVPGGTLLVSRNVRRRGARDGRSALHGELMRAATRVGVRLTDVQPALPGVDFPLDPRFPEGDPHEALIVVRA